MFSSRKIRRVHEVARVLLPTIAGLYVAQDDTPDRAATVFVLDDRGFWWHLQSREATADEVAAHVGTHPLERLIRNSDADL